MTIDLALPRASVTPSTDGTVVAAFAPYTRIPDAVLLDPRLTPGHLRIYAVIARRADREKASAFPSYATIANDAHVSRTSAINGVKALVTFGYLAKKAQESGQGDPTSNLYTISGEGSQIFVLPRTNAVSGTPQAVQKLDHRSANFVPQVVQPLDHGGAKFAPELDSMNKKKSNKTQENRRTRAPSREDDSAIAAADPELQKLLNDFQENIGALTGMAQAVICQLVEEHGANSVRQAIQEAVIYEKRSLAYVRRVLGAWKRNDCSPAKNSDASSTSHGAWDNSPAMDQPANPELVWPPPEIDSWRSENLDTNNPAVAAWNAISSRVPELGRYVRVIEPKSLTDNVLTVSVPDQRTYIVLTSGLSNFINRAAYSVMGSAAKMQVEIEEQSVARDARL